MGVAEDVKSGNFSLYAQLTGLTSSVFLLLFAIISLTNKTLYRILAIIIAALVIFLEIPLIARLLPKSDALESVFGGLKKLWWRFVIYLAFSALMWLGVTKGAKTLGVGAFLLTLTCFFYLIAGLRKQDPITAGFTGGTGAV
ncbi:hypothetical protein BB561_001718 [Smittium simulii]|uniref:Golgi apparatus membrane protein TVP18 n=1 Tax=Smittium simulii TaxID=133385 RepID=A0A2T9YTA3_9FUNG|nr:hypothetical protein BB561_001718 [Smittium simulii]